ncbi:hypothetical protein TSUD_358300 [Trifolium subterraneum]|uniref:Disease resistance R13L4/SHOC-2-like LRR domain-containing protein n=1 Tax=Trifolium subterraneum TaxID=3900 RepID=A0A2Z6MT60_TRISU|nr:hypothetical protein TSUD_358300 [Trifolium subterraneum]
MVKVRRVKRKSEFLESLIKDHEQLGKKQKEVESRVRSFWDIDNLSRIHVQLSKLENQWVEATASVITKANGCCAEYRKQSPGSFWGPITVIFRWEGINFALTQIDDAESMLKDHFKMKDEKAKDIYMSMEKSRSKSRSLLDQYTIEEEDKSVAKDHKSVTAQNQEQNMPSPSFDELMNKTIDLFSGMEERWSIYLLLALHAFLKDLSQLRLETETEMCWRTTAEEIIKDAMKDISSYLRRFQIFGIFSMSIPFVMSGFKKKMKLIVTEFNELLKYDLTFIDRAAVKSIFHSIEDDREIASSIESIKSKLRNLDTSAEQVAETNSMYDALEKIHKQLQEGEETAARNACVKLLKFIANEHHNSREWDVTETELNQSEIRSAINLLDNLLKTCSIKRQESTKVVGLKNEEQDLVSKLTTRSASNPSTLSIVGMKGVGKTTLAKKVVDIEIKIELENFAKKVVGKCGGLPLAILSLGCVMSAKDRRFAYHFDDFGLDANSSQAFKKKGFPLSVLFFDKREGSKPGEHIVKILSTAIASERFFETRVLDLECIFKPQLPKTLRKLNNLKYLSLRWTYLEELPSCISKLLELETLDLKHTCINYIPSSIWKLKKLKKLYLPQNYRSKLEGKPSGNVNKNLHTLSGVFLYGNYPLLGYLDKLKSLKKLKLAFQLKGPEQEILAKKIVKLEQLHSLTLKSVDETGDPKKLKWINVSKLKQLSSLRLFGKLEDKLRMRLLPNNLTDLTLSASKLSDDPMPELQNLPKLKSLCFYADSYTEIKMVCTSGGFQQLQVLRFWNLEKLKEWAVEEGAMPSLMEF